ncbi:MAG: LysR family transcriptional regulator [Oscillospiraceae bacterium]
MERLNLRQLEIFSAVVDAGSFTAAAEKLYLAQSTVSDNVRALEELLHLKLFHRESKRRLTLTLEGKRVYRYAQDILGRCSALLLDVAVDSALELTLGASTVPAQSLLPGYMARFARENPACRCTLLCGDSAAVQRDAAQRRHPPRLRRQPPTTGRTSFTSRSPRTVWCSSRRTRRASRR